MDSLGGHFLEGICNLVAGDTVSTKHLNSASVQWEQLPGCEEPTDWLFVMLQRSACDDNGLGVSEYNPPQPVGLVGDSALCWFARSDSHRVASRNR